MNKLIFACLVFVSGLCGTSCVLAELNGLADLALKHKTDKGYAHDYMPVYERYFNSKRDHELTILEIGFAEGNSARMWEEYFSKSELHFIDINKEAMEKGSQMLSHRSHTYFVDQSDATALRQFVERLGKKIDIIIDDGSHKNMDQVVSFETLFPYVKSGGCYVIEDLHTSYWSLYGGGGDTLNPVALKSSAITFLLERVHDVNYYGARTGYADFNRCPQSMKGSFTSYQREIESIHFHCSMCFIFKR